MEKKNGFDLLRTYPILSGKIILDAEPACGIKVAYSP